MSGNVDVVTFILSLLPVGTLEWLLTAFAWLQLHILSAKGSKAAGSQEAAKKRKKKKPGKRRRSIESNPLHSSIVPDIQVDDHNRLPLPQAASEVDVVGESILFEANEQHRKEFEGFLRSVKDIKDVQNWLKNFSNDAPRKIAIVKLSRRILDTDYGTVQAAAALSFMFKFGLFPIVVHGGWNELTRDTISEVVARRREFSHRLKSEIRKFGVGAAILTPDVCSVEPEINPTKDPFQDKILLQGGFVSAVGEGTQASLNMEGGLSFQVKSIDHKRLTDYLERGKIPIWDGVAVTTTGTKMPLNGDVTTVELAHLLQPYRIIFACNDGGILDKDNKAIPVVYMDKDYEDLMSAEWVSQRRKIQLLQLRRIVSVVPPSCSVVVTAIDSVTHQLMYPRLLASETVVKRAEENNVQVISDMSVVDKAKLQDLIEDSFGRALAKGYLDNLHKDLYRIYLITGLDGEYNGCAVITHGVKSLEFVSSDSENENSSPSPDLPTPVHSNDGSRKFYYLCKFCVRKSAQGVGLGDLLWRCIQRDIECLYWRSRTNNPLNPWYYARCQGSFRTNAHFTVFWYGDDRFEDGASLITDALSKPVTILPVPT